jgi:hypothetical protein
MTNTMTTDHETEAQIAEETGHELGCLEWGLEELLEAGITEGEIYAVWIERIADGRQACHCIERDDEE